MNSERTCSASALEFALLESLKAYPDDSHIKLYDFMEQSGENKLNLDRFRHLWSKAFVSSRVFGQQRSVDLEKLSHQLAFEYDEDSVASRRYFLQESKRKNSVEQPLVSENVNSSVSQAYACMNEASWHQAELRVLAATLYREFSVLRKRRAPKVKNADMEMLTTRKALRGIKISWTGKRRNISTDFQALDTSFFRPAELLHGIGQPKSNIPVLKTTAVTGIKMSSARPCLQTAAWNIYSDLVVLSAAQDGALTPFPVAVYREGGSPASQPYCLFVFENPACVALTPLLGGQLAINMRRNIDVFVLWASQLGKLYFAIAHKKAGALFQSPLDANNVFVREDGRLLIGNIRPSKKSINYSSAPDSALHSFARFSVKLLKDVLCLSRAVYLNISSSYASTDKNSCLGSEVLVHDLDAKVQENQVLSITEGSTLFLGLHGCPVKNAEIVIDVVNVEQCMLNAHSRLGTRPTGVVCISTIEQRHVDGSELGSRPVIRLNTRGRIDFVSPFGITDGGDIVCGSVHVEGVSAGEAVLKISYTESVVGLARSDEINAVESVKFIKICVLPRIPVLSSAAHELIGLLEADYENSGDGTDCNSFVHCIFQAQCMYTNISYEKLENDSIESSGLRQSLHQKWSSIKSVLNDSSLITDRLHEFRRMTNSCEPDQRPQVAPAAESDGRDGEASSDYLIFRYGTDRSNRRDITRKSWK